MLYFNTKYLCVPEHFFPPPSRAQHCIVGGEKLERPFLLFFDSPWDPVAQMNSEEFEGRGRNCQEKEEGNAPQTGLNIPLSEEKGRAIL